jgi:hypothetical protein
MSMRLALAALVLIAATSGAAAKKDPPPPDKVPLQWTEFHFSERGFVASFPDTADKPKAVSTPVSGQNPLLQHDYQVSLGEDTVYSIVVFEYPEGKAPQPPSTDYFLKIVSAYAKGSETRVRQKGPITIDRRQAYEAMAEDAKGKLNHLIDVIPNGDRVYLLVSAGPKGHAKSADAVRFRDSFRLLGGDAPVRPAEQAAN